MCSVTHTKENHVAAESMTVRVGGILQVIHPTPMVQTRKLRPGDTQLAQLGIHKASHPLLDRDQKTQSQIIAIWLLK